MDALKSRVHGRENYSRAAARGRAAPAVAECYDRCWISTAPGPSVHIVNEGVSPGDLEDRPGHLRIGHEEDRALSNILRRARAPYRRRLRDAPPEVLPLLTGQEAPELGACIGGPDRVHPQRS